MNDRNLIVSVLRHGEWVRTQLVARVAFGLGRGPWEPEFATRVLKALRSLEAAGQVQRRDASEIRRGDVHGVPVAFPVPRREWRPINTALGLDRPWGDGP